MNTKTCAYCRKEIAGNSVTRKIIFRDSRYVTKFVRNRLQQVNEQFVNEKMMEFCSNDCATSEQMAREG